MTDDGMAFGDGPSARQRPNVAGPGIEKVGANLESQPASEVSLSVD